MSIHQIKNHNLCHFVDIGLDQYQCTQCGLIISSYDGGAPVMICSVINDEEITQLEQTNQACSKEQIEKRFSICQSCEFFQNNSCMQCGCRVVRNREFKNKLLWKNDKCPIGKWDKEV